MSFLFGEEGGIRPNFLYHLLYSLYADLNIFRSKIGRSVEAANSIFVQKSLLAIGGKLGKQYQESPAKLLEMERE